MLVAGSELARVGAVDGLVAAQRRARRAGAARGPAGVRAPGFPTDHPNFRGQYEPSHPLAADADLLVFLGARLFNEFEAGQGARSFRGRRVIHSHTDARHVGVIHGVDVGLVGDQRLLLRGTARGVAGGQRPPVPARRAAQRPRPARGAGALTPRTWST